MIARARSSRRLLRGLSRVTAVWLDRVEALPRDRPDLLERLVLVEPGDLACAGARVVAEADADSSPRSTVERHRDRVAAGDAEHPDPLGVEARERQAGGEVVAKRAAVVSELSSVGPLDRDHQVDARASALAAERGDQPRR